MTTHTNRGGAIDLQTFAKTLTSRPVSTPTMLYNIKPHTDANLKRTDGRQKTFSRSASLELYIAGIEDGLAEAILMHVGRSILNEIGAKKYNASINSMGDKESAARFGKEFYTYMRRNLNMFGACCRNNFRANIHGIFKCEAQECVEARYGAPKPIDFLSEQGRHHFKEVLEHLESLTISYMLNEWLIDATQNFLKVYFSISSPDAPEISISGGRLATASRLGGLKKNHTLAGAFINITSKSSIDINRICRTRMRKPRVFVVQLGCEARKIGLMALERLRRAKIPVIQNINSIRLTDQIGFAEEQAIPYMVIIGHKEALEGAAILRNTLSRSQRVVPIDTLPTLVKRAKTYGL